MDESGCPCNLEPDMCAFWCDVEHQSDDCRGIPWWDDEPADEPADEE